MMTPLPQYDGATVLTLGRPLPGEIQKALSTLGTGTIINLPSQLIVMGLQDYRESDLEMFEGPARFRVGRGKTFLLISPMFEGLSFDIIWSPLIARSTGEPAMAKPDMESHMAFNFVLADGNQVIRGMRMATISSEVAHAIWRAQGELAGATLTAQDLQNEMMALFQTYPAGIPEGFFHAVCDFGD